MKREDPAGEVSLAGRGLEPVIETYNKYYELLKELAAGIAENLSKLINRVGSLSTDLRKILPITSLKKVPTQGLRVSAVDAGSNGKDLILGYQPISIAVGATFLGVNKLGRPIIATIKPPKAYFDEEEGRKFSSLLGYYLMYRVALRLVEHSDILLLDGPLYLPRNYYGPGGRNHSPAYLEVYDRALQTLGSLLRLARVSGIPIVGVVKRVRSTYLATWLGLNRYPDSLLSMTLLGEGEAVGPVPIVSRWEDMVPWLDRPSMYRPWALYIRRGAKPFRLDIPEYALEGSDELASVIYSLSEPSTGLPIPVIAVDRLSKLTDRQASLIYRLMLRDLSSKIGIEGVDRTAIFSLQRGEAD